MRSRIALGMLPVVALAGVASADTVTYSDTINLQLTNWADSVTVPKFDPALGTLKEVCWEVSGHVEGSAAFESEDASPTTVTMTLQAIITLMAPDNSPLVVVIPAANTSDDVTAYDGVTDFGGTSGRTYNGLMGDRDGSDCSTDADDLADFTGVGDITLPVSALGASSGSGAGNLILQFMTQASAEITVTYDFNPIPAPSSLALLGLGGLALSRRRR